MAAEVEICVWVEGSQKWVSGVNRRTTCYDLIRALLKTSSPDVRDEEVMRYIIVERWKRVEKPLDHEQRILKVWKSWGEAVHQVRFSLRLGRTTDAHSDDTSQRLPRVAAADDSCNESCGGRSERSRRRHKMRLSRREATAAQYRAGRGASPSLLSEDSDDRGHTTAKTEARCAKDDPRYSETMERLMRLVVAQGETIQNQLKRLNQRESQIESYEQQMHLLRVQNLGNDYLLSSYLHDNPGGRQDQMRAPSINRPVRAPVADQQYGVPHHNDRLLNNPPLQGHDGDLTTGRDISPANVVSCVNRLPLSVHDRLRPDHSDASLKSSTSHGGSNAEEKSNDSGIIVTEDFLNSTDERFIWDRDGSSVEEQMKMLTKLEDIFSQLLHHEEVIEGLTSTIEVIRTQQKLETTELEDDLKRAAEQHSLLVTEARANEQQIRVLDTSSTQKKKLIDALLQEEVDSDQETRALQAHLDYIIHLPPTAFRLAEEGDDPPPLYPPPVYPLCLVQPLMAHHPPQLVHAVDPPAYQSSKLVPPPPPYSQTQDTLICLESDSSQALPFHKNEPSQPPPYSKAAVTHPPPPSLRPDTQQNIPYTVPNKPLTNGSTVNLGDNSRKSNSHTISLLPKQNIEKYNRTNTILNNSNPFLNNQRNVANASIGCSQCSSQKLDSRFSRNAYIRSSLDSKTSSISQCKNCKTPLPLSMNNKTNQKPKISSESTRRDDESVTDDDTPPPLPQCPPPAVPNQSETFIISTSTSDTKNNNKPIVNSVTPTITNNHHHTNGYNTFKNNDSKQSNHKNSNKTNISTSSAQHLISNMPVKCRSSTASDISITNSSSSSSSSSPGTTNILRCIKVTNERNSDNTGTGVRVCENDRVFPRTNKHSSTKKEDSVDSNSDTGLSSLHSSSDEGFGTLDTLV